MDFTNLMDGLEHFAAHFRGYYKDEPTFESINLVQWRTVRHTFQCFSEPDSPDMDFRWRTNQFSPRVEFGLYIASREMVFSTFFRDGTSGLSYHVRRNLNSEVVDFLSSGQRLLWVDHDLTDEPPLFGIEPFSTSLLSRIIFDLPIPVKHAPTYKDSPLPVVA